MKQKYRIYINISKINIAIIFLFFLGIILSLQEIIDNKNYHNIKTEIKNFDISEGQYIKLKITTDNIMGTTINGKFSPFYGTTSWQNDHKYLISTKDKDYYISLLVPKNYQNDFSDFIKTNTDYSFIGKVEKLDSDLYYEAIMECLNLKNKSEVDKIVDSKYAIRITDRNNKTNKLLIGICVLVASILLLLLYLLCL